MASGYRPRNSEPIYQDPIYQNVSNRQQPVRERYQTSGPPVSGPPASGSGYAEYDDVIPGDGRGRVVGVKAVWERRSSDSDEGKPAGLQRRTSQRLEEDLQEGRVPQRGAVGRVSKEWRVHEDGAMAIRLQEEENIHHYGHNRAERHLVRKDIIDAKIVQHEEELRLQEEKMREIEEKRRIADRDADFVQRMLSEEEDQEDRMRRIAMEDERLARELMSEVSLEEEEQLKLQENHDERVAMELQKREERRYERYKEKKRERELERARKRLEKEIDEQRLQVLPTGEGEGEPGQSKTQKRLSNEGVVEDTDFTDFYRVDPEMDEVSAREAQERQDAELARLLQDQEHKRGGMPSRDKLKSIEERDGELAKVIHEQEKMRAEKVEKRMRELRHVKTQPRTDQATSSLSLDTVSHDVIMPSPAPSTSSRLPIPQYPSPPNYEQAVSRSRENLSQSPSRYGMGQSPPAYHSPQVGRSRDMRIGSQDGLDQSSGRYGSRDSLDQSLPAYNRDGQSHHDEYRRNGGLNRSFESDTRTGQSAHGIPVLPRDEFRPAQYGRGAYSQSRDSQSTRTMPDQSRDDTRASQSTRTVIDQSRDDTARASQSTRTMSTDQSRSSQRSSYPLHGIADQYANFKSSQSAHTISNSVSRDSKADQSALRSSQTMQNMSRDKPVSQSRVVPHREELRRAVDPHEDSDSDDAGFQGQGQGQARVQGHPHSRTTSRPQSTPSGAFNIVTALDPTYRPGAANQGAAHNQSTNQAPGQDSHQYLRNQYSTLEYGESADAYYSDDDETDEDWMPVQGQRRQSAGKSSGKKRPVSTAGGDKDKCKQQ